MNTKYHLEDDPLIALANKVHQKTLIEHAQALLETPTRKDFRDVANTVRAIEDPKKRQEFADHHADIFSKQNPRFDHSKWHAACGTLHFIR